jgi:hypothetical protein
MYLSAANAENIAKCNTRYAHTTFIKYDPPHFVEWQCAKHPGANTIHIDKYIEDMRPEKR